MKSLFIVGNQRSGTTLLSVMLGQHPDVLMEPRAVSFRMLTAFNNAVDILPYNLDVNPEVFYPWLVSNDYKGRLAALLDLDQWRDYSSIKDWIHGSIRNKLEQTGKTYWGDKAPNLQFYLADLLTLMPGARVIHIVRDGRANAYSLSRRSYQHLQWSAQQWVDGNLVGLVNRDLLGNARYHILKYEDLLTHPEDTLRRLCEFLRIDYSEEMLRLDAGPVEEKKRYVKSKLDTDKIDAYRTQLSEKQIRKIERIQAPLLRRLGYDLHYAEMLDRHRPLNTVQRIWYHQLGNIRMLFRSRQKGMRDRRNVEIELPLRSRVYTFLLKLGQDLLSTPLVRTIFRRTFYKKRHYRKDL